MASSAATIAFWTILVVVTGVTPASPEDAPVIIRISAVIALGTVVLVLLLAAFEGNVPRWSMPLPLSYAASAGMARACFRVGLAAAALGLNFAIPAVIGAYTTMIKVRFMERGQVSDMPFAARTLLFLLQFFLQLAMIGFFVQAMFPFDSRVLAPLRKTGVLDVYGNMNICHSLAACILFISTFGTIVIALVTAFLSGQVETTEFQLRPWYKLFLMLVVPESVGGLFFACFAGYRLHRRQFNDGSSVALQDGQDVNGCNCAQCVSNRQKVPRQGSTQMGILCTMLAFWWAMAVDVEQICNGHSSACEPAASDIRVMHGMFVIFAVAAVVATSVESFCFASASGALLATSGGDMETGEPAYVQVTGLPCHPRA